MTDDKFHVRKGMKVSFDAFERLLIGAALKDAKAKGHEITPEGIVRGTIRATLGEMYTKGIANDLLAACNEAGINIADLEDKIK